MFKAANFAIAYGSSLARSRFSQYQHLKKLILNYSFRLNLKDKWADLWAKRTCDSSKSPKQNQVPLSIVNIWTRRIDPVNIFDKNNVKFKHDFMVINYLNSII